MVFDFSTGERDRREPGTVSGIPRQYPSFNIEKEEGKSGGKKKKSITKNAPGWARAITKIIINTQ